MLFRAAPCPSEAFPAAAAAEEAFLVAARLAAAAAEEAFLAEVLPSVEEGHLVVVAILVVLPLEEVVHQEVEVILVVLP